MIQVTGGTIHEMVNPPDNEPDYTPVAESPPATKQNAPLQENLSLAMQTPGQWLRIASYSSSRTANTVASSLRHGHGKRRAPDGKWQFKIGHLPNEPERYGIWALYEGS